MSITRPGDATLDPLIPAQIVSSLSYIQGLDSSGRVKYAVPASILPTTNVLTNSVNTITSVVNGVSSNAPAVNSVAVAIASGDLTVTVNGVASSPVTLPSTSTGDGQTVSSASPFGVLSRSGGGINSALTGLEIKIDPASPTIISTSASGLSVAAPTAAQVNTVSTFSLSSSVNTLNATVNGINNTVNIINSVAGSVASGNLTVTVNGVSSAAISLGSLAGNGQTITAGGPFSVISKSTGGLNSSAGGVEIKIDGASPLAISTGALGLSVAAPSNSLSSSINTMTSNVGGNSSGATIINTVAGSVVGSNLTITVNGVSSAAIALPGGGGGSVTADNGLTMSTSTNVQLGGTLLANTNIRTSTFGFTIDKGVSTNPTLYVYPNGGASQGTVAINRPTGNGVPVRPFEVWGTPFQGHTMLVSGNGNNVASIKFENSSGGGSGNGAYLGMGMTGAAAVDSISIGKDGGANPIFTVLTSARTVIVNDTGVVYTQAFHINTSEGKKTAISASTFQNAGASDNTFILRNGDYLQLPNVATYAGCIYRVKLKSATGSCQVYHSSGIIDGFNQYDIHGPYGSAEFQSDGVAWNVIGKSELYNPATLAVAVAKIGQKLGFYGATPVAQQNSAGITTVAQLITVLQNLGLLS